MQRYRRACCLLQCLKVMVAYFMATVTDPAKAGKEMTGSAEQDASSHSLQCCKYCVGVGVMCEASTTVIRIQGDRNVRE